MLRFVLLLIASCAALGPPTVLLVSGSDSGGGAGLQAEIKTCEALGVFSTNAVTAITAQNTVGVHGVHGLPPAFVVEQMDAVFDDFAVDAVKTGLLASVDVVEAVARRLRAADVGGVVVDQSHGRTILRIEGARARDLLAKGTGIDVHARG